MSDHTTCNVCKKGVSLDEAEYCRICRSYVHSECYDHTYKMCNDCAADEK